MYRSEYCFQVICTFFHLTDRSYSILQPISIDFRETAPTGSSSTMFTTRVDDPAFDPARASKIGGLSIGIPGEIRGLEEAYKLCGGGVSWSRLFQPAADIARKSKVGKELGRRLNFSFIPGGPPMSAWILKEPIWSSIFAPEGKMLQVGETLRRENYALTLERIGREGADAFYKVSQSIFAFFSSRFD